jgi:hypothetical protein
MQTEISVVEFLDSNGKLLEPLTRKIVEKNIIKDIKEKPIAHGYLEIKHYDDYDSYYIEHQPVHIKENFIVITNGKFIFNENRPYEMSVGFPEINHLAYQWSATILLKKSYRLYNTDVVWSDSGISTTKFDMYSYHSGFGDSISYQEERLDWEVWKSLDLNKILSKWLTKSDIRDSKLGDLGIN